MACVNPGKSQAMVVNTRYLRFDDTQYLHLGWNRIEFYRKVKNLGLLMNDKLTWNDQVSKVCWNVLFTLKRLWTMWHFTPLKTCQKLVTSLMVCKCPNPSLFSAQSCAMVCHLMSRESRALRSIGKSVCHICADRGALVIGSELFFVLFFFLNT
jgi:hypothetical protein